MSRQARRSAERKNKKRRQRRAQKQQTSPNYFKNFAIAIGGLFGDLFEIIADKLFGGTSRGEAAEIKRRVMLGVAVVLLLAVLAGTIYGAVWAFTNKNSQVVYFNLEKIGAIKKQDIDVDYIESLAKSKLIADLGSDTVIEVYDKITLELVHSKKKDIVSLDHVVTTIYKNFDFKVEACVISVDGIEMGTVKNKAEADSIFEEIIKEHFQEGIVVSESGFAEKVITLSRFVKQEEIENSSKILSLLTKKVDLEYEYTVVSGESYYAIATKTGVSLEEMGKLNPNLNMNEVLKPGTAIKLFKQKPFLSVRTVERKIYTEVMPKVQEVVYNPSEYKTHSKVVQQGSDGQKEVSADIIRIDGLETERLIVEEKILVPVVNEKIEKGTSNMPPRRALGVFVMPVYGRITDYFSARGGSHNGLDIDNKTGASILASDGGKVIKSGNSGDGYGLKIVIDHQNGFQTLYAHNKKLLVSVGDNVYQGEKIALMGSTGNSTGSHLHFELLKNGKHVNPLDYIN